MEMYLIALVVAFGAGAFAAAIGAVGAVTLTGLAAFVALLVAPGVGHVDFLGIYAFGLYLGPHVSFAPACAAAAYAGSRGYIVADGKDILSPLIGTGKASPMIVGGIFGVIGYFLNVGLKLVVPGIDTIALTVVLVCLMGKVFGKRRLGEVIAPTPAAVKNAGGRFSRRSPILWLEWQSQGPVLTTIGLGVGILGGWIAWLMLQDPGTAGLAIIPGWAIGVVSFFFFASGLKIPVTHHIAMVAGQAAVAVWAITGNTAATILWGVAFGLVGTYGGEFFSRLWTIHGHGFVDPPASIIFAGSVLVWIGNQVGIFNDQFIVPSIIIAAAIAYAIYVSFADRNLGPEEEKSVLEEQGLDKIEPEPIG